MCGNPKLTDKNFYERYPKYDALINSLEIPNNLEPFEVVCPPRKVGVDTNEGSKSGVEAHNAPFLDESILLNTTTLGESDLYADFNCLICYGILRRTMVVKDCMHRFCCECIEKCVRIGLRECPQCRLHISSRRALRSDKIMDALTLRLFPKAIEFEEKYQELLIERNKRQRICGYASEDSKVLGLAGERGFRDENNANHEIEGVTSVHLKSIVGNCFGKLEMNAEDKHKGEDVVKLKLPLYVRLSYIKQYILGKIRLEKPDEKYQVQLYLNKECENHHAENGKENIGNVNFDSRTSKQENKTPAVLLGCEDEKIGNLVENRKYTEQLGERKELVISYKLSIKQ
ncbi:hypothetical protein FG386_002736 [Cryptosporidium ryanae]|uniref:uncharacterized protein n=1 Tax=Cryptosporidium ryanae TaxID=515981 RepID=UPI00351AABF8|nr:hypothetical protein FG386_002736 [Cryptosporidium ryanae]